MNCDEKIFNDIRIAADGITVNPAWQKADLPELKIRSTFVSQNNEITYHDRQI